MEYAFAAEAGKGPGPSPRTKRLRVLIVDDHADTRDMYKYFLRANGWEAQAVETGAEVPLAAAIFRPDIIVMDLAMPGVDGFQATRMLKFEPRTSAVPVVVLTGHGTPENVDKARRAGAKIVLMKPLPPEVLQNAIERVLRDPSPKRKTE